MMASDAEAGPSQKRIKVDTIRPNDDSSVQKLIESFTQPDNLEHFPLIILLKVFSMVDDIDLLNLAKYSTRFESIAKMVVNERYTREYFCMDATKFNSPGYKDFLELFGSQIKNIDVSVYHLNEEDNWVASLLSMTNNYAKFKLYVHLINESTNEFFLEQHMSSSITHLTLCVYLNWAKKRFAIPKFCNLKKLQLNSDPCISFESLKEIILNNYGLESLSIGNIGNIPKIVSYKKILESYPFGELMKVLIEAACSNQKLKEFEYAPTCGHGHLNPFSFRFQQLDHIIDAFVDSLKHLESLALSKDVLAVDKCELLRRLGSKCKNVKDLKLYQIDGRSDEDMFNATKSFKRIESLHLQMYGFGRGDFEGDNIVSLVANLPLLRHLYIKIEQDIADLAFVIMALLKCPPLEKITFEFDYPQSNFQIFNSAQFFNNINNSINRPNVKIEVKYKTEIIGSISKDQVIWRNKFIHWVGYDPIMNSSNIEFLDLANQTVLNPNAQEHHHNCSFDVILSYLDLHSLQALSRTNRKCSQLVDNYVERYSQQQGVFTITDEFFTPTNVHYKQLDKFVEQVANLRVNIYHDDIDALRNVMNQFQTLNKLYFTENCGQSYRFVIPQMKHFIYDGTRFALYSELYELSEQFPDIETLDIKFLPDFIDIIEKLKFRNLKKFTFQYNCIEQLQHVQSIFKDTNTELNATKRELVKRWFK